MLKINVIRETSSARTRILPALDDVVAPPSPKNNTATPPIIGSQINRLNI
jgi:hypothetical protein